VESGKAITIQIGTAGLPEELELRLSLACGLLAASQLRAEIQDWKGRAGDILVTDLDSGYGRLAYEVATRRNMPVLAFSSTDPETPAANMRRLDRQAPAAAIARTLQDMLLPSSTVTADNMEGLLGICLQETGSDDEVLARNGHIGVIVRHTAGRIHARSMSELLAASARLLDASWLSSLYAVPKEREYEWLISRSLESFLVTACRQHQASLPLLGQANYRLSRWPDLGGVTDDMIPLRLAALLYRAPWSISALAQHLDADIAQVNAFCWATLASGALTGAEERISIASAHAHAHAAAPSMLQRVARHFGLKIGPSYAGT
jgi:hypothetical protein